MKDVLHILDHSLPEHDGYSFRSHSILTQLRQSGLDLAAITGPKQGQTNRDVDMIDGVQYFRTPVASGSSTSGVTGQLRTISLTRKRIAEHLREHDAGIIHAHSPCLNGLAALGHGLPLVYEMRSSWEDASVSVGTTTEGSMRYRLSRALETFVARRADAVVVICEGLKAELVDRGIAPERITVVPNALPENMFVRPPVEKVSAVRERFGLNGSKVIGFFGSFFEWEGVDSLIKAFPAVLETVPDARLFIAGGGNQEAVLHKLVAKLGLEEKTVFAGRVSHDDIPACYAAADAMAYPRVPDRLTNMVTPLKPLESMAQGTVVVASDVGGHKELIADGQTGTLFRAGDLEDLAHKLVFVLTHPEKVREMTGNALQYVQRERRWSSVVEGYMPVYEKLSRASGG